MSGQWDDLMKLLIGVKPQHFVSWLLVGARFVREISKELKSRTIEADILYEVILNGQRMILHIEFQRRRDHAMGKRLWEYNVLTMYTTGLPVCSIAFYFKKSGKVIEPPYKIMLPNGQIVHLFYFMNIKLWEIPTEALKQFGLGLYPLLPLTKGGARQEVVNEVVTTLAAAGEKDLLALTKLVGALAFKTEAQKQWFARRFIMHDSIIEESWVYQEWVQKWREEERQRQCQTVLDIVQERFPELVPLTKKQTDAIEDPEVLRRLIVKMGVVQTAQEAEQYLLSVAGAAKKN
jgi:hypothetical protein